jgi:hypothetical protein
MKYLIIALVILLLIPVAYAHLDAGSDEVVDGYLIDFGYAPKDPSIADSIILNFNLLDNATQKVVDVTSLWIRIADNKTIVFAGTLKPNDGNVNLQLSFPRSGNYGIYVKFYDGDSLIVENKYGFKVSEHGGNAYYVLVIIAIVIAILFLYYKNSKKKKHHL